MYQRRVLKTLETYSDSAQEEFCLNISESGCVLNFPIRLDGASEMTKRRTEELPKER